jgi:DNA-binding response OmpR family regulator
VTNDSVFATHVSQQIMHFGYTVQHIRDFKNLLNVIADQNSVAVMLDICSTDNQSDYKDIFEEISGLEHSSCNFIFTSDLDDKVVRLKSIRAGGAALRR